MYSLHIRLYWTTHIYTVTALYAPDRSIQYFLVGYIQHGSTVFSASCTDLEKVLSLPQTALLRGEIFQKVCKQKMLHFTTNHMFLRTDSSVPKCSQILPKC